MRRLIVLTLLLALASVSAWAATGSTVRDYDCPTPITGPTSDYPLDNN